MSVAMDVTPLPDQDSTPTEAVLGALAALQRALHHADAQASACLFLCCAPERGARRVAAR